MLHFILLAALSTDRSLQGAVPGGPTPHGFGHQITHHGDLPLYDAFQTFCVDTGARKDRIAAAIKIIDAQVRRRGPSRTRTPQLMRITQWNFKYEGHAMTVSAVYARAPHGRSSVVESDACSVIEWGHDTASVGALRQWAGLPRSQGRQQVTSLDFELRGSAMRPVNGKTFQKAMADGRAWTLTITGSTATLMHYLKIVPR